MVYNVPINLLRDLLTDRKGHGSALQNFRQP